MWTFNSISSRCDFTEKLSQSVRSFALILIVSLRLTFLVRANRATETKRGRRHLFSNVYLQRCCVCMEIPHNVRNSIPECPVYESAAFPKVVPHRSDLPKNWLSVLIEKEKKAVVCKCFLEINWCMKVRLIILAGSVGSW